MFVPSAWAAINSAPFANPIPIPTPIAPPINPSNPDSIKNKSKMSEFFAPTAFIVPISLVLSITEVYIVFMIPIPPTSNEIAAIPTRTPCTTAKIF